MGLRSLVSLLPAIQATRLWLLPWRVCLPLNAPAFAGRTSNTLIWLRDRALIGTIVYSFPRGGAALKMKVRDYFQHRKRWWLRLHEKGGKSHEVPCHPQLGST